jgi:hypothetical protein
MANWSTLFFAGIAGYAILLFRAKRGPEKQNPPKGGFVECRRKPNYFSFTSL